MLGVELLHVKKVEDETTGEEPEGTNDASEARAGLRKEPESRPRSAVGWDVGRRPRLPSKHCKVLLLAGVAFLSRE